MTAGKHVDRGLLTAYLASAPALPAETEWAVEAHLENCRDCRLLLADVVRVREPALDLVLSRVWIGVEAAEPARPAPTRPAWARWARTWAPPTMGPWVLTGVLVALVALAVDLAAPPDRLPPLVLLLAPIVPLFGVAAAWSRRFDPLHELTAATPGAGLRMVLRRTAVVLVVVIPVLAVAGAFTDLSPALWLLPCLAFTVGTLALGTVVGVGRAALVLGLMWTVFVIAPALPDDASPPLLRQAALPWWVLVVVGAVVVVVARAKSFTAPGSRY
ncbi:zf-HC2 domain-containing protein [Umezawaea sp. Da 62-37]|uniref:zf-HC2 domain-containing protein n=1 Tax=Umezawaea sp. Da 62-37 TaxID=3075927 RepID=UPI0028F74860|nr:zf-HC2 domain-containing protein [Umezawaea sp. Da 62-37]WNV88773.1 zf-HC2 domain-containing protein [Umezawaea sp. Da 62-37]